MQEKLPLCPGGRPAVMSRSNDQVTSLVSEQFVDRRRREDDVMTWTDLRKQDALCRTLI